MRAAIYYTPGRDDPLTRAAARWLGRDAFAPQAGGSRTDSITAEPRRYGFHATIKAPFRLRPKVSLQDIEQALRGFCAGRSPCPIGPLRIALIDDFFALVPVESRPELGDFAAEVMRAFEPYRAPLTQSEIDRRRATGLLSALEEKHLADWGYPFVLDRFRFHMTLTSRVAPAMRSEILKQLEDRFTPLLDRPLTIDALAIFVEETPDSAFHVQSVFALGARS